MTFSALIDRIRDSGTVLELPAIDDDITAELRSFYETHTVEVRVPPRQPGEDETVVLYRDDEPVACDPLESVVAYLTGEGSFDSIDIDVPDVMTEATATVVQLTDASRDRMLRGSRQIEKRAWRSRTGTIHAGFQRLSVFQRHEPTERLYRQLARSGVDVHLYGVPDVSIETEPGLTVHRETNETVASTWFLAYQIDERPRAALLAQERSPNRYTGFWTFSSTVAADVVAAIESDLLTAA
ncbi:MAG: DICT sensory domain-containing protein [Halobacteriales archaeon]